MTARPGFTADVDRADVAAVLAGDSDAFARLVDRHQGRIIAHLTRLVGAGDADDLAQETFVRAYTALERYDPAYPFRGWLLVIASRLAANHGMKRRERPAGEAPAWIEDRHDPAQAVADADDHAVLVARLESALARLMPDDRALYELRFRQELPVDALAAHFAISSGTLKVRVHRLRTRLAALLGISLEDDP